MRTLLTMIYLLCLGGCAGLLQSPASKVDHAAREGGFEAVSITGVPIKAWLRAPANAAALAPLTVYIEGDGAEWRGRYRPPLDPTPRNALALRLALRDDGARVAYVGRPCQYLDEEALANCPPSLWISGRYSEAAVTMVSAVIDQLLRLASGGRLNIVGYSGGGAIAALVAARRTDVACVVTLAAPLDINAWAAALKLTPLSESLNPLDFAQRLHAVPQWHFAAAGDEVVPPATLRRVVDVLPASNVRVIEDYDHDCCWVFAWQDLRRQTCLEAGRG